MFDDNAEVSEMSSRLTSESRIYADKARDLNRQVGYVDLLVMLRLSFKALQNLPLYGYWSLLS